MAPSNSAVVLIVNGNESNRDTLSGYLERAGWQVWKAKTAEQGLALAKQQPQVILLDLGLLDLNSREVSKRLKAERDTRAIPVLFTSVDHAKDGHNVLEPDLGWDAYLAGPIDSNELVAMVSTLSRLRNAEAKAEACLSKLDAVMGSLVEGVIVADHTGSFLTMNPAALRIHGFDSSRTMPVSASEQEQLLEHTHLDGTSIPTGETPVARAAKGESVSHFEMRVRRRDTGKSWIGSYSARLVNVGHHEASVVIVTFSDITLHKESEKALSDARSRLTSHAAELEQKVEERTSSLREAISRMEEFSYTVSHDLRAPLRSIKGYAEILVEDHGPRMKGEGLKYLERIVENGERMERLVNDVLTISRISNTTVKLVCINAQAILQAVIREQVSLQPGVARVTIEPLPNVVGHESLCIQVFSNLLGNAAKFVEPGTVPQIRVWADQLGDMVRINIRDNGIGINSEYHQKIFGMFERLDTNSRYGGTGIGLAIVRRAVEKMNGRVGVESDGQSGSRFWVELPAWTGEK